MVLMLNRKKKTGKLSRRDFIRTGVISSGAAAVLGLSRGGDDLEAKTFSTPGVEPDAHVKHGAMGTVGEVDHEANGYDPMEILYDWDYGEISTLPDGQTLREYTIVASDKEIEIAPGVFFPAWTYNGRVPGPSIRCVEGDRIRITFINGSSHPHTIHFHGIHSASMDGVPGVGAGMVATGERTIYEFDAFPFGCHLYHCHAIPLKRHIHKGLYGAFIVDPDPEKYQGVQKEIAKSRNHQYPENKLVNEMLMVMNGFDTNFDGDNEIYAVNSVAFAFMNRPIQIRQDQLQRLYLINITEFDPINSIHIHANFFSSIITIMALHLSPPLKRWTRSCSAKRNGVSWSSLLRTSSLDFTCFTRTRASSPSWAGWVSLR